MTTGRCAISLTAIVEVKTIGIGGAVTIAITLLCNLTLLPAILVLTGSWALQPLIRAYEGLRQRALTKAWVSAQRLATTVRASSACARCRCVCCDAHVGADRLCLRCADDVLVAALRRVCAKRQETAAGDALSPLLAESGACRENDAEAAVEGVEELPNVAASGGDGVASGGDTEPSARTMPAPSCWRYIGRISLHHRWKVLACSVLCFAPFLLLAALASHASASTYMIVPRASKAGRGMKALDAFETASYGTLAPLTLMVSATSPAARPLVAPSVTPNEAPYAVLPFCRDAMVSLRKAIVHVALPASIRKLLDDAEDCAPIALALPTLCNASAGPLVVDGVDVRPLARFCTKVCAHLILRVKLCARVRDSCSQWQALAVALALEVALASATGSPQEATKSIPRGSLVFMFSSPAPLLLFLALRRASAPSVRGCSPTRCTPRPSRRFVSWSPSTSDLLRP